MKTRELLQMHVELEALVSMKMPLPGKFAYAVARNLKVLAPVMESFRDQIKLENFPVLDAYEKDRVATLTKLSEKEADGTPRIVDNQYVVLDRDAQQKEMADLLERHPDVKEASIEHQKLILELEQTEEPDPPLFKVDVDLLPHQISAATAAAIFPMITVRE